jgi:AMP deaminase
MEGRKTSGTSCRSGSSTTSSSRTTYAGSYRYHACMMCTKRMDPSRILKISFAVCIHLGGYRVRNQNSKVRIDIFRPLFEVTKKPSSHPKLHAFLQRVIGFDTVDDESKTERRYHRKFPYPKDWNYPQSPPYSYWSVIFMKGCNVTHVHWQGLLYVC